eukprot:7522740-Lingulodinium_polyedra.AAC.1
MRPPPLSRPCARQASGSQARAPTGPCRPSKSSGRPCATGAAALLPRPSGRLATSRRAASAGRRPLPPQAAE